MLAHERVGSGAFIVPTLWCENDSYSASGSPCNSLSLKTGPHWQA